MKAEVPVLVVGAGPTGLLLAIELARRGVVPRVVDAAPEPPRGQSRALAVFPRTLEVLDRVGAAEPLAAAGRRIRGIHVWGRGRRSLIRLDVTRLDTLFPFVLSVPQARTESVLLERMEALGVRVERPVEVVDVRESEEVGRGGSRGGATGGPLRAVLRHPEGEEEIVAAAWVAGCDGARSTVRERAGIRFPGPVVGPPFAFSDCRMEGAEGELRADEAHAFLASDGVVAAIPLPRPGFWRVIVSLPEGPESPDGIPLPLLQDLFRARSGLAPTLPEEIWSSGFRSRQRLASRYRAGRVVLAGDAAHAHSPVGGQGMNTGLRDAFALGWRLARVSRGDAPADLLDDYVRERRPIGRRVVRATGLATRAVGWDGPLAVRAREAALGALARTPRLQRLLLETLTGLREEVRTPEV